MFADALECGSPAEQAALLDRACAGDEALRGRVEALLRAHGQAGGFLEPDRLAETFVGEAGHSGGYAPGTLIAGRYKLLEEIAAGGMGTVWVAEQTVPVRRRVAVKLIKPGMDSRQMLSRFEAERQALALMDHPNIARVSDGGITEAGRPFFVMEYVKGMPITQFCDEARLTLAERLKLFVPVCQAVQHAHQKGIIHRDLKPSNILVCLYDGKPVPKVIDFGLAKAMHQPLTERTLYTSHGLMVGTPLYMSPEQAEFNNLDIDTRTDVYSLGVILYELLTGSTPLDRQRFKDAAWQEIVRLIKEQEPSKPSTKISGSGALPTIAAQRSLEPAQLSRLIRGDLDWIVMKSLEKERSRRYETANGLARDIERYLHDEPIEARPPSAGYRFRKFARRNKGVFVTVVTISATLLAASGISTWQAIRATRAERAAELALDDVSTERDRAVKAERRVQESLQAETAARVEAEENLAHARSAVEQFFTLVSQDKLFDVPNLQPMRKDLLEAAILYYKTLVEQRPDDPALLADLAIAYLRIAPIYRDFNRTDKTIDAIAAGLDQIERLRSQFPDARKDLIRLAGFWKPLRGSAKGDWPNDVDQVTRTLEKLVAVYTNLHVEFPSVEGFQSDLAAAYYALADWQMHFPELRLAGLEASEESLARWKRLRTAHPENPNYYDSYLEALANAEVTYRRVDPEKGKVYRERLMREREEAYLLFPEVPRFREYQILVLRDRGKTLEAARQIEEARQLYQQELDLARGLCREFPGVIEHAEFFLAAALRILRVGPGAGLDKSQLEHLRSEIVQVTADAQRLGPLPVDSPDERWTYAVGLHSLGETLLSSGNSDAASSAFRQSLTESRKLATESPQELKYRLRMAHTLRMLCRTTDGEERCELYTEAEQILSRLHHDHPAVAEYLTFLLRLSNLL